MNPINQGFNNIEVLVSPGRKMKQFQNTFLNKSINKTKDVTELKLLEPHLKILTETRRKALSDLISIESKLTLVLKDPLIQNKLNINLQKVTNPIEKQIENLNLLNLKDKDLLLMTLRQYVYELTRKSEDVSEQHTFSDDSDEVPFGMGIELKGK